MDKVRQAVSLIFIQGRDIFTIKRQNYLKSFPGYTAFPGGKVDKEDYAEDSDKTLFNAAIREAKEELAIDLEELIEKKHITSIKQYAKATSPDFNPQCFEVVFYLIKLKRKPEFKVDSSEAAEHHWLDASSLMQEYNFGKRLMIYPIRKVIESLGQGKQEEEFINFDLIDRGVIPMIEPIKNLQQYMPLSNTLPPAQRTNAFIIGDQVKMLVDPSPKDLGQYRSFLEVLRQYQIDKIIITHHHGDHHQFAPEMARMLNVPIYISRDSHDRCLAKYGKDYFEDIQIVYLHENDVVGKWRNKPVHVLAVPGHDEGQYALMPDSKEWCIVGDLFQGIGTVVVGGAEGDMKKYMQSLQKIIDLAPACVIPSHGIALGGTFILEKTLKHRIFRENQVLDLYKKGNTISEMLKMIYFDLSKRLMPYAQANIESHLKKLKDEGKLS